MFRSPLVAAALASLVLIGCRTTDASRPPEIDPEAMMAEMQERATPAAEHALLGKLVGEWNDTMSTRMEIDAPWQDEPGSSRYEALLGGRYVMQHFESSFAGMPFEGIQILGYDKLAEQFTASWRDSFSTWHVTSSGQLDESGTTIEFQGTMRDVVTPDGRPFRSVLTWKSDDETTFDMFDVIDGVEVQVMKIRSTRK